MAKVFLSYDRDDTERARPVALALEKAGHFVWWDLHIRGGEQFSKKIDEALQAADTVVVLWSKNSIESPWVRDEAAAGRDRGCLIPATIDGTDPPLGFRQFQTIDLSNNNRCRKAKKLETLIADIRALGDRDLGPPGSPPATPKAVASRRRMLIGASLAIAGVAIIAALSFKAWHFAPTNTVAVTAANGSAASQALARDLLAQLGELQSVKPDALQLGGEETREDAALLFKVADESRGSQKHSTVLLVDGKSGGLLWSKSFDGGDGTTGDLYQQIGYNAAQVLDCAASAHADTKSVVDPNVLKRFLRSCALYADGTSENLVSMIALFRQITSAAPGFAAGWAKLLLVEAEYARLVYLTGAKEVAKRLPKDIADARRADRNMPEAFLAQAALLPDTEFEKRIALLNRALETDPGNAPVLAYLTDQLRFVGRNNDAVEAARRAVAADPLSPTIRENLVSALTYAGKLDAARAELTNLERLWPGAQNIVFARFTIELRYGDPKRALHEIQLGKFPASRYPYIESFLKARIDPSPQNVDRTVSEARRSFDQAPTTIYHFVQVLGTFGRNEEVFSILLHWQHPALVSFVADGLFRPALKGVHRDPRMIAVAKRLKILDYWQLTGSWPDFCFDPDLPYNCKAEAAKLRG